MLQIIKNKKAESLTIISLLLVGVAAASVSTYAIWTRSYQTQAQKNVQNAGGPEGISFSAKEWLCVQSCEEVSDREGCLVKCYETSNETPEVEKVPIIGEKALYFNGKDSYVEIPASDSLNITGNLLTVETWIKWNVDPKTADQWANTVYKTQSSSWQPHYQLQHNSDNTKFEFSITTTNYTNRYVWSTTAPEKDKWYHVVGTYDGANIRIYVNGKLEGTKSCTGTFSSSPATMYFGSRGIYNDRNFNGNIDEVSIYSRSLTEEEILSSYNREGVSSEGLSGKWIFDEDEGTTIIDSSGNGNNGTLNGTERT